MRKLTVKQQAWVEAMLTGVTPTEAARLAKYPVNQAKYRGHENTTKSYLMVKINARRAEIAKQTQITVGYIQAEHQRLAVKAEEKGDLPTATRNKELAGKTIGAYIDRTQTEPLAPVELTDEERVKLEEQAAELTKPRIKRIS